MVAIRTAKKIVTPWFATLKSGDSLPVWILFRMFQEKHTEPHECINEGVLSIRTSQKCVFNWKNLRSRCALKVR
jgi:hypothetical protein